MSTNLDLEKRSFDPEGDKKISDPVADAIRNGSLDKKILEHSHDADDAMKAFQESQGQVIEIDAATNKRLLRRIDWNLMPVCTQSRSQRTNSVLALRIPSQEYGL
jgi:ACS family allantoate permease-like MFS transporter